MAFISSFYTKSIHTRGGDPFAVTGRCFVDNRDDRNALVDNKVRTGRWPEISHERWTIRR